MKKYKEVNNREKYIGDRVIFSVTYPSYNYGHSKHFKYKTDRWLFQEST